MRNKFSALTVFLLLLGLSACTREQYYRGIPEHQWQHLSGEQKQLIVDKAYQTEMQKDKVAGEK